jgi:hypothetical protein
MKKSRQTMLGLGCGLDVYLKVHMLGLWSSVWEMMGPLRDGGLLKGRRFGPFPLSGFLFGNMVSSSHMLQTLWCHLLWSPHRRSAEAWTTPLNFHNCELNEVLLFVNLHNLRHFNRLIQRLLCRQERGGFWENVKLIFLWKVHRC